MAGRKAKVIVNKPIEVLAANGETALLLEPGRSKGTVVIFIDDGTCVVLESLSCPEGEEMFGPLALVVKTDPWDDEEEESDMDEEE